MSRRAVVLIALLAACGGRTTQTPAAEETSPHSPAAEPPLPPERLVLLFEALSSDLDGARADCARLASVLSTWTRVQRPGYAELVEQVAAHELAGDELNHYENRLAVALDRIMDSTAPCMTHEKAQSTFRAFDAMIESPSRSNTIPENTGQE